MDRVGGTRRVRLLTVGVLAVAGTFLVACGDDDGTAGSGGESSTVQVTLSEWAVAVAPASVPAGEVTLEVANDGEEVHELVVLRTDLGMLDLPTAEDGSVDEEGSGDIEVLGEVEDIASGGTETFTLDMDPGHYVLLCNIVEEDMDMEGMDMDHDPSHYQNGMRAELTVE